jgi:hypothetical protein
MDLNYLLSAKGIDTKNAAVLVMRHTPTEPELREALPWLAADQPTVFNAYQQFQGRTVEKQLTQAAYLASFIGHLPGEALFVGLYLVNGQRPISFQRFWKIQANQKLQKLGMKGWPATERHSLHVWFDLKLTDVYREWQGKLIIRWPPPEVTWSRWAQRNTFDVKAIAEESLLDKGMPSWDRLVLTWEQLRDLPKTWITVLSQWRGVYFILDKTDGKGYVGSACGAENMYGRWLNYADTGDAGNKFLRKRAPGKFMFSILELVAPAMGPKEVILRENNWKERLHTRVFGLNAN